MSLKLYPFRYRDPLTGKWVRARYSDLVRAEPAVRVDEWSGKFGEGLP